MLQQCTRQQWRAQVEAIEGTTHDQEVYLGLWPEHQLSHGRTHTVFIHKRFFLQAFLNPRRQDDMFPLWSTDQLQRMTMIINILRCPTRELGIAPGISIIHDNMGQFRMIEVGSNNPSILA